MFPPKGLIILEASFVFNFFITSGSVLKNIQISSKINFLIGIIFSTFSAAYHHQ